MVQLTEAFKKLVRESFPGNKYLNELAEKNSKYLGRELRAIEQGEIPPKTIVSMIDSGKTAELRTFAAEKVAAWKVRVEWDSIVCGAAEENFL